MEVQFTVFPYLLPSSDWPLFFLLCQIHWCRIHKALTAVPLTESWNQQKSSVHPMTSRQEMENQGQLKEMMLRAAGRETPSQISTQTVKPKTLITSCCCSNSQLPNCHGLPGPFPWCKTVFVSMTSICQVVKVQNRLQGLLCLLEGFNSDFHVRKIFLIKIDSLHLISSHSALL